MPTEAAYRRACAVLTEHRSTPGSRSTPASRSGLIQR
jgi:hypothetical protein